MYLVSAVRRAQRIHLTPLLEPCLVTPGELLVVPDDRRILRRHLKKETVRIGFQADLAVQVADFEFVMRALFDAGNENFPYAGGAQRAQLVHPAIPRVEIAHHAYALGIRGPNSETGPGDAVDGAKLGAQL